MRKCKCCHVELIQHEHEVCDGCLKRGLKATDSRTITLRAHYDAAYLAALGGCCADTNVGSPDRDAHVLALESVRTHAARMTELERVIADYVLASDYAALEDE